MFDADHIVLVDQNLSETSAHLMWDRFNEMTDLDFWSTPLSPKLQPISQYRATLPGAYALNFINWLVCLTPY